MDGPAERRCPGHPTALCAVRQSTGPCLSPPITTHHYPSLPITAQPPIATHHDIGTQHHPWHQQGILIGKQGAVLSIITREAIKDLEAVLLRPVELNLQVTVR